MKDMHNYIQVLETTLNKQAEILQQILDITQEQSRIADAPNFDETMLEDTLNRKEVLIARLNELDDGFVAVYGRVRKEVMEQKELHKDTIERMQDTIKRCTDLGVEIKVLEERNKEKLVQCFMGKQKEFGVQRTAASVVSRYHQTMHNAGLVDSIYFNQKK